jgi:hypothetical protein
MQDRITIADAVDLWGFAEKTLENYTQHGHFTAADLDSRGYPFLDTERFLGELLVYWTGLNRAAGRRRLRKLLDTLATHRWSGLITHDDIRDIARMHDLEWVELLMSDWVDDSSFAY